MLKDEIQNGILTKFRKSIYRPFTKAITDYNLIEENDSICVCISGGKDSFLLAKLMQELKEHGNKKIDVKYLVMNPGFSDFSLDEIKKNADVLNLPITIVDSNIFDAVKNSNHKMPCYICAKMRRGCLYSEARKLGCNKIALGHHFDDVIETTIMSMIHNGIFNTMLPILDSENFEGMKLIRPLYLIREDDIISFTNYYKLKFSTCNCPLKKEDSKRKEAKEIIKYLNTKNENADINIFKASENVDLDRIRGTFKKKF